MSVVRDHIGAYRCIIYRIRRIVHREQTIGIERTTENPRSIVVVGAGLAGLSAVQRLRADGFDGRLVVLGAEARRPYSRPPLSKSVLAGTAQAEHATALGGADDLDDLADFRPGVAALSLQPEAATVRTLGGDVLAYDRLLVATGAQARRLDVPGAALSGIHVLRTIDDCAAIRGDLADGAPVVVVGGGFIGCEVAATLATAGFDVTIIEPLPTLLFRALGAHVGELVGRWHRDHGVRIETGTAVSGFVGTDRVEAVESADGRRFLGAVVVVGVGAVPDTDWLEGSGVALADGVLCDEFCASSTPGVFAAGDVARFRHSGREKPVRIEHWTNAGEQGSLAGANMLLDPRSRVPYSPIPYVWSDQYGVKLQIFGFADGVDEQVVVPDPVDPAKWLALFGRAGRLAAVAAFGRPAQAMRLRNSLLLGHSLAQTVTAASAVR